MLNARFAAAISPANRLQACPPTSLVAWEEKERKKEKKRKSQGMRLEG